MTIPYEAPYLVRSVDDIYRLYLERKREQSPVVARMVEIRDLYNADIAVPLPELDASERPAVANLAQTAIDQMGERIASTLPNLRYFPKRQGIRRDETYADIRRRATLGWWEANRVQTKLSRRARWFLAYANAPVVIRPDFTRGIPLWQLRDPLCTFPAPALDLDELVPPDCMFTMRRSREWCYRHYPVETARLAASEQVQYFDLLEYVDANQITLAILGTTNTDTPGYRTPQPGSKIELLYSVPNRTGMPLAVVPGRVTLDRPMGQYDGIIGMYQAQARLMALHLLGMERGVFPEQWLVASEGRNPQIITQADPRTGIIGEIKGGTLETVRLDPSVMTTSAMAQLEYGERHSASIPAEFGGSSPSNVRTGRRGDAVLSATIDHTIAAAQNIFAESLHAENEIAVATARAYFGDQPKSFHVSWKGAQGRVDYTPNVHFDDTAHEVSYAYAGADASSLNIIAGQQVGMDALSRRRFMEINPIVTDVDAEHDQILDEKLESAFFSSILTLASTPEGPWQPVDFAAFALEVRQGTDIYEAAQRVHQAAQARQAAQAPPGAPETMPGLSMPGQGAEAGAQIPQPAPSAGRLAELLTMLRRPQMQSPAERQGAMR